MFAAALGLTAADAHVLAAALRRAAAEDEAEPREMSVGGPTWRIDFDLTHAGRIARVRSGWVVDEAAGRTRLVTVHVL